MYFTPCCDRAELLEALTKFKRKRAAAFARTVAAEAARDDKVEEVKTGDGTVVTAHAVVNTLDRFSRT